MARTGYYEPGPRGDGSVLGSGRLDQVNLLLAERMHDAEADRSAARPGRSVGSRIADAVEHRLHGVTAGVGTVAAVDPPPAHHGLLPHVHMPALAGLHRHH